jgi:hypothetical protein
MSTAAATARAWARLLAPAPIARAKLPPDKAAAARASASREPRGRARASAIRGRQRREPQHTAAGRTVVDSRFGRDDEHENVPRAALQRLEQRVL